MRVQTTLIKDSIDLYQGEELVKSIPFTFNAQSCLQKVQRLRADMLKKNADGNIEGVGQAFWELLCVVFGEGVCNELNEWYDGDYLTMLADVGPILTDLVYPAVDRLTENIVKTHKRVKQR